MLEQPTRILIVEDSDADFLFVCNVFRLIHHESYEILRATGVRGGIAMLAEDEFDVCFVDYMLEDGNGLELISEAQQMDSPPPMIMLTGHDSRDVDVEATQAGASDYLCKSSITPSIIERSIRYAREQHLSLQSLKRAHEQIRLKDEALLHQQKLDSIGTLAGGIAHEFNNLLQTIRGYSCFAQDGLDPNDQRSRDLTQVVDATDRGAALTSQLLSFSRADRFNPQAVEISDALEELAASLAVITGASVDVKIACHEGLPPVKADPTGLKQVLLNLCVNARDAMPDGGVILIEAQQVTVWPAECASTRIQSPGSYIAFSVTDTGTGIRPEIRDRIFDPFFTTKEVGKGTGLGLAMVHGFARRHQGDIQVESAIDEGTTFRVLLPVDDRTGRKEMLAPTHRESHPV